MTQEHSIEVLISHFESLVPLKKKEIELVRQKFHYHIYRKRQYALHEGNVCAHYIYVIRGCLRMYKMDHKGNINILKFANENNWVTDLGSFYNAERSVLNIDALEQTAVFQISRDDMISLYREAPKFDRIFRILTESGFLKFQYRLLEYISSTAEERFKSFMEVYPGLAERIPQVQIAAFLGITPEFLSRLRKRQSKNISAKP